MASHNVMASVNTLIPKAAVTEFERVMLNQHGFQSELDGDHYYFFADSFLAEELESYNLEPSIYEWAAKDPANAHYFDGNYTPYYPVIFQNIIRRHGSDELKTIEIEGAFLNSRMARGELGGFAEIVTADGFLSKDTGTIMQDLRAQLDGSAAGPIVRINEGKTDNDYEMQVESGGAWIGVGDVSVYLVPDVDGLKVEILPKGKEGHAPLEAVYVAFADVDLDAEDGPCAG
jgi:hypothetical protein